MAFQVNKERVLPGGLNLLAPGDKMPEGDSLILDNWRVDQAGMLRSRRGMTLEASTGGNIHSLFRVGDYRYAGLDFELRYGTQIQNFITNQFDGNPLGLAAFKEHVWVMNQARRLRVDVINPTNWGMAAPAAPPVATLGGIRTSLLAEFEPSEDWQLWDFNQNPPLQNPQYFISSDGQGSITATAGSATILGSGTAFTPEMVGRTISIQGLNFTFEAAVAAFVSATEIIMSGPYTDTSSPGLSYSISFIAFTKKYSTTNKQSGTASLWLDMNPPGRWQARREFFGPVDLRIDGEARSDDILDMWFFTTIPSAFDAVNIELFSGSGNPRGYAVAFIDPANISNAPSTWTKLQIRRAIDGTGVIASNPDLARLVQERDEAEAAGDWARASTLRATADQLAADLLRYTPYFRAGADFNWADVTGVNIEFVINNQVEVYLDLAQFRGGPAASIDGEVEYYVTFGNTYQEESNPTPASAPLTVKKQQVTVTLPISTDPQVTKRHLYRIGAGLNEPLEILVVNDNSTALVQDTVSNEVATTLFKQLSFDNDLPPPAAGLLGPYLGKLIAWRTAAHRNRLYWCNTDEPVQWVGADDEDEGNWIDVGESGEDIVSCTDHVRRIFIYKSKSRWIQNGDPDGPDPEKKGDGISLVGEKAIANAGEWDYFQGAEGIYRWAGEGDPTEVTGDIKPIFLGEFVDLGIGNNFIPPMNLSARDKSKMEFVNGRLYFSYCELTATQPNVTLVLNTQTGKWYTHRVGPWASQQGFSAIYYEGQGRALLAAAQGNLYNLESGLLDWQSPIPVAWQSRQMDFGLPDNEKVYGDMVIRYRTGAGAEIPSTLNVTLLIDDGTQIVLAGTLNSLTWATARFRLNNGEGLEGYRAAVKIDGNVSSTCLIKEIYLHWWVKQRWAKTYDSGVIDLGPGLWEVDAMEYDIEARVASSPEWTLDSDFPSGIIAQRAASNLVLSVGRQSPKFNISIVRGRRFRLILSGPSEFIAHKVRLRVLKIPEALSGTQVWESRELPVGA